MLQIPFFLPPPVSYFYIHTEAPNMKRLLYALICSIPLWGSMHSAQAQAHLKIAAIIGLPDSAYTGLAYPVYSIVQNVGNTAFVGNLQLLLQTDSGSFAYLYQSSNTVTLLPFDTVGLVPPNGFTFSPNVFKQGGNVVVVWPYTTSPALIDTVHTSVFIYGAYVGIRELGEVAGLTAYPNPTADGLWLETDREHVESVRIFDLQGRVMSTFAPEPMNRTAVPMEALQPGMYLIEVRTAEGHRSVVRVLKLDTGR